MTQDRPAASGTLTFLFSDIEGSSRLEQEVGTEAYAALLARHRSILRAAFEAHGGEEQGTEGDSFFVIFPSAGRGGPRRDRCPARPGRRGLAGRPADPGPDRAPHRRGEPERRRLRRDRHQPRGPDLGGRPRRAGPRLDRDPRPRRRGAPGRGGLARPRDLPAARLPRAGAAQPARHRRAPGRLPRPPDGRRPPEQPAVDRDVLRRSGARARRGPAAAPDGPAAHRHRARRHRQDALRDRAGASRRGRLPGRDVLRPVRAGRRPDPRAGHDRPGGRDRGDRGPPAARGAQGAPRRTARPARARQLRAAHRGGAGHRRPAPGRAGAALRRDQPGDPPPVRGAGVPPRRADRPTGHRAAEPVGARRADRDRGPGDGRRGAR